VQLVAGDNLANVPDWALNGSISYSWLLDGFNLGARLDGAYQSARGSLVTPQNPAYFIIKAYSLFGMHLSMDQGSGWQICLDVDNLFDSFSELSGRSEDSNLINTVTPARPRTVSLRLRLAP
jgi:outer membrane receptor protein involved in Fe transport